MWSPRPRRASTTRGTCSRWTPPRRVSARSRRDHLDPLRRALRRNGRSRPRLPRSRRRHGASGAAARGATAEAERDWTAEERELFSPPCRQPPRRASFRASGSFSRPPPNRSSGSSASSSRPTPRRRKPRARRPRVLFFAHGGLVEEREGLLPVLARRRFWELNGVYPVYFVWETGLRKPLARHRGGAVAPTRAARGAMTDRRHREARAQRRQTDLGPDEEERRSRRRIPAAAHGLVAELAGETVEGRRRARSSSTRSATAPDRSCTRSSCRSRRRSSPAGVPPVERSLAALLAPAVTSDLFKSQLQKLVGPGNADHAPDHLHDGRRARTGRQLAQAVRQVAPLPRQRTRSRTRVPTQILGTAEEPETAICR